MTLATLPSIKRLVEPAMATPLLGVNHLSKRFTSQGQWVVNDVSFAVAKNEILVLVGPSGCGKTTTLRLIAGFERPDAGEINIDGNVVAKTSPSHATFLPPEKRGIGIVFQDYALFPHLTVLANVMFGMNGPRQTRRTKAMELLEMLHMADYARRRPHALSGGQQQRVALVRSIAASPRLILLDEPFSNLDVSLREQARSDVRQVLHDQGIAAILVTHDREEAMSVGDRVAVMTQGQIRQIDTPQKIYHEPGDANTARFLGGLIELKGHADGQSVDCALGHLTLSKPAHGPINIALRPEQLMIDVQMLACEATCNPAVQGRIEHREFRGHHQLLQVRVGDLLVPVLTDSHIQHAPGEEVNLRVKGVAIVFGSESHTQAK